MQILKKFLKWLLALLGESQEKFRGEIMYIVKADNPEVGFEVSFEAFDSEGNVVPEDTLDVTVESDNPDAVAVVYDETTESGTVSFGSPGLANLNVTVKNGETLLGSFGAQFTVTVGDPASISGGSLVFEDLVEA